MGYAKVLRRQNIPNPKQLDGTKTGNRERGTRKWKMGIMRNLNPSPISNFISNSRLFFPFFLFFRSPCSFPCSLFLVTRSSLPVPRFSNTPQTQSTLLLLLLLLLLICVSAMKSLMRHRLMKILKNIDCLLSIHDLLEDVALSFCDVTCF